MEPLPTAEEGVPHDESADRQAPGDDPTQLATTATTATPPPPPLPLGSDEFPDEMLAVVCSFLGVRELGRLACVSRRFTEPTNLGGGGALLSPIEDGARLRLEAAATAPGGGAASRHGQGTWLRALWWADCARARLILARVIFELEDLRHDVACTFFQKLELSIDCPSCKRMGRTIRFSKGAQGSTARCSDCAGFEGVLRSVNQERHASGSLCCTFELSYRCYPFVDKKRAASPWTGHPTWGRGGCTLQCPDCKKPTKYLTQTNVGRPFTHTCASCGFAFVTEVREMPILEWADPSSSNEWRRVPARFPATQPQAGHD